MGFMKINQPQPSIRWFPQELSVTENIQVSEKAVSSTCKLYSYVENSLIARCAVLTISTHAFSMYSYTNVNVFPRPSV